MAGGVSSSVEHFREAAIQYAASRYKKASEIGLSGRDTECAAFRLINRELANCTNGRSRITAIGRNHSMWSLLVKDLAMADNRLPDGIKAGLIGLALWSMRYSTQAMLQDLSVEPLIEVNNNMLEGLLAQPGSNNVNMTGALNA